MIPLLILLCVLFFLHNRTDRQSQKVIDYFRQRKHGPTASMSDLVNHVYVVSIPERQDYMTSVLQSFQMQATFLPPILASQVESVTGLRPSEVACFQAHRQVWRDIVQKGYSKVLILEDDIRPCVDLHFFQRRLGQLKQELHNQQWDIMYAGRCRDNCHKNKAVSLQLVQNTAPLCTHAYFLTASAAQKLLARSTRIHKPVDDFIQTQKLCTLTVRPSLFFQNRSGLSSTNGHNRQSYECTHPTHNFYHEQKFIA